MASSLPLVTTGLRRQPSTPSSDGHGGGRNVDPINWCAWAHQGHRLWASMPDSFWVFTYKVALCPFPGNHVWMSCPYAHRGERARRRDPRSFLYAAATCPEYAESKRLLRLAGSNVAPTCPRGLLCGLAHSVFETWLHPTRFRTVMCDACAQCPRRICFFAHCLAQRRREDDEVPLVVFPVTQPPPAFVPGDPRTLASPSSSSSSSRSRSQSSISVVPRPADRVTPQTMQMGGKSVRLLTRSSNATVGASSSPSSRATVAATAAVTLSAPSLQALPPTLPVDDDEDIDFVAIVTGCCLAAEEDSKAESSGYPHLDLIMNIIGS